MPLTERENFLRNARRQGPEFMPCYFVISGASWEQWREEMEEVVLRHPLLFPGYRKGQRRFDCLDYGESDLQEGGFEDAWGCVWSVPERGLTGIVTGHPLEDWSAFETWQPPDPARQNDFGPIDWQAERESIDRAHAQGRPAARGPAHGFLFLRLTYLRGFENAMLDMATGEPRLRELIARVEGFNEGLARRYRELGADALDLPEDLGTQTGPVISPAMFREWIMPSYKRLVAPCKAAGMVTMLHSDGHILQLLDLFEEIGFDIVNPQDLVNGIENLEHEAKGRFCIRLDVDRQKVVPFGTAQEIEELIEEGVRRLGSPAGGLELICGIYPPTPPENVDAVCRAMEKYRTWWFDGRAREARAGIGG